MVAEQLLVEYDVDEDTLQQDLANLIELLAEEGLLTLET
jgi:hypothetical protein